MHWDPRDIHVETFMNMYISAPSIKKWQYVSDISPGWVGQQERVGMQSAKRGSRDSVHLHLCDKATGHSSSANLSGSGAINKRWITGTSICSLKVQQGWVCTTPVTSPCTSSEKTAFLHFLITFLLHPCHESEHIPAISVLASLQNYLHTFQYHITINGYPAFNTSMQKHVTKRWEEHDLRYILFQLDVGFSYTELSRTLKSSQNFHKKKKCEEIKWTHKTR